MRVPSHVRRALRLLPVLTGLLWLGGCATPTATPGDHAATRQRILETAERLIGTPYLLGGESPGGMDCSGLVQYTYWQAGIRVPRTTAAQLRAGNPRRQVLPGDLLFFHAGDGGTVSHVGIYAGKGRMIHASSSTGRVLKTDLSQRYWRQHLIGGATLLGETNPPVVGRRFGSDGFSG